MANPYLTIPVNIFNVKPCQDIIKLLKHVIENPRIPEEVRNEVQIELYKIIAEAEQTAECRQR